MSSKKIIFRADGNSNIGLGHLYRLLALIEIYKEDYECLLLTRSDSTISIFSENLKYRLLSEFVDLQNEPEWFKDHYEQNDCLIVLDGYQFDFEYQTKLSKHGFSTMIIDDYAQTGITSNIIVNHSMAVKEEDFKPTSANQFGLGAEYAILRPSFREMAKKPKKAEPICKAFVCFGGADFNNLTSKCVRGILEAQKIEEIHVVLGGAYQQTEIFELAQSNPEKVFLHQRLSEEEIVELMKKCNLAIVPSSTISYEVCSVKMISLCGYYIDNQAKIYQGLNDEGLIYPAGDFNQMSERDFASKVEMILNDKKEDYQKMLNKQHKVFDGRQNERFLELTKEYLC